MFIMEPKVIRPIELMLEGERGYTGAQAITFDKQGIAYISVNLPFKANIEPESGFILGIQRTGKGYGQYTVNGTLSNHEYMAQDIPLFDPSAGSFNIFWTPLGYTGSKETYLSEFFPPPVLQIYRNIKAVQNDLEQKVVKSPRIAKHQRYLRYNVDLDVDTNPEHFPKTALERKKLVRDMQRGDYSRLFQYAEYFEELGEPLSDQQLDTIIRITDNEKKEKSS